MAFPTSPSNGQTALINGINYTYNSTNNAWTRVSNANSALYIYTDQFTANGATTTFNLTATPPNENFVTVVVDGVGQLRSTYSVTGNVITFDSTFESGAKVEVTTLTGNTVINSYNSVSTGKSIALAIVFSI